MKMRNALFISTAAILYCINNYMKQCIFCPFLHWYFNDILAGMMIIAYLHLVLYIPVKRDFVLSIWAIEMVEIMCGIFWEWAAPAFKPTAVADPWDLLAYMAGGAIYWIISSGCRKKPVNMHFLKISM